MENYLIIILPIVLLCIVVMGYGFAKKKTSIGATAGVLLAICLLAGGIILAMQSMWRVIGIILCLCAVLVLAVTFCIIKKKKN